MRIIEQKPFLKEEKIDVLIIHLFDHSYSMFETGKLIPAKEALELAYQELKHLDYRLLVFSDEVEFCTTPKDIYMKCGGTALNKALIQAFKLVKDRKNVLISCFTDGQNTHFPYDANKVNNLIETYKDNVTLTFICTEKDAEFIKERYNVSSDNIKSYIDNPGEMKNAIIETKIATQRYLKHIKMKGGTMQDFYNNVSE